jgi:hypothetical protein
MPFYDYSYLVKTPGCSIKKTPAHAYSRKPMILEKHTINLITNTVSADIHHFPAITRTTACFITHRDGTDFYEKAGLLGTAFSLLKSYRQA